MKKCDIDLINFLKKYEIWVFLTLAPLLNFVITYAKSKGIIEFFPYTNGRFYALFFLLVFIVKITCNPFQDVEYARVVSGDICG